MQKLSFFLTALGGLGIGAGISIGAYLINADSEKFYVEDNNWWEISQEEEEKMAKEAQEQF